MRRFGLATVLLLTLTAISIGILNWRVTRSYGAWCVPGCQLDTAMATPADVPDWCGFWTDGSSICRRSPTGQVACEPHAQLTSAEQIDFDHYAKTHVWRVTRNMRMYEEIIQLRQRIQSSRGTVDPEPLRQGIGFGQSFGDSPALRCEPPDVSRSERSCTAMLGGQRSTKPYCLKLLTGAAKPLTLACQPGCMIPVDHYRSASQGVLLLVNELHANTVKPLTTALFGWLSPTTLTPARLSQCQNWRHHCNGCSAHATGAGCTLMGCGQRNSHALCTGILIGPN
jgi:hypothetical protein